MNGDDVSRRAFLGSLAAVAGASVAGCQSPTGDDPSAEVPTANPDRETVSVPADEPYAQVYQEAVGSVASVRVYDGEGGGGQGSAWVYADDYLVTNEHVVSTAEAVDVRFQSTGWLDADVVGTDVYSDLAVLTVDRLPDDIEALPLVDREPPVGTEVVAIGNPYGYAGSVSAGIVSGVDRNLEGPNEFSIPDAVQTDAAVNPGNSGGPLVDLDGNVVGVINAGGGDNLGFAISAALTERVVPELIDDGDYGHSYMGVRLQNVTPLIAEANPLPDASGVYIHEVIDGTPSDGVLQGSEGTTFVQGVQTPTGGDVVVAMGGEPIPTRQALSTFLALQTSPGDPVSVDVIRDGDHETVELTLGRRPAPP